MTCPLPSCLYTCAQTRAIDQAAIRAGTPGVILMKRAARAALETLQKQWPTPDEIVVLCGSGNNAGDGYVLAALASSQGKAVQLIHVVDPALLQGDAQLAYAFARQEGVAMSAFDARQPPQLSPNSVVVDGLLGTGLSGDVRPQFAAAIHWLNQSGLPVLALDIPSGLHGDTGAELGAAVKATVTVCFVALKPGLFTARGPALAGVIQFDDLHIGPEFYPPTELRRIDLASEKTRLPERAVDAHKGHSGHVLVIGGDVGYGGAALMAAEAALISGAGLVSLATQGEHVTASLVRRPEVIALGVRGGPDLEPYLARAKVLVVGPGLGRTAWSQQLLQLSLAADVPTVVDADGLNLLAAGYIPELLPRPNWVLTPHPAEAARLLNITTEAVQADRFDAVRRLQRQLGGVVLLKGAGTLIADDDGIYLANVGNAGLATGGSGDVLSGIIGALLAQGLTPSQAACLGVCLHGGAAELIAEQHGIRGMMATDLFPALRVLLNE